MMSVPNRDAATAGGQPGAGYANPVGAPMYAPNVPPMQGMYPGMMPPGMMPPGYRPRRSKMPWLVGVGVVVVALVVTAILLGIPGTGFHGVLRQPTPTTTVPSTTTMPSGEPSPTVREITYIDMDGNKVVPDDPSLLDPSFIQKADANEDVGVRFKIPSVNLNVPLGEVNQVDGLINPPGFKSVFRVKNMGATLGQAARGTVYVVAHSLHPGRAPGNYVIDIDKANIIVGDGSEVDVGDRTYSVTLSMIIKKSELSAQTKLWANTPGMLVFITDLQYKDAASNNNVVIVGQLVS